MAALTEYLHAAMRHAEYERLDDGDWYAHIAGLPGLWASAKTVEESATISSPRSKIGCT